MDRVPAIAREQAGDKPLHRDYQLRRRILRSSVLRRKDDDETRVSRNAERNRESLRRHSERAVVRQPPQRFEPRKRQ